MLGESWSGRSTDWGVLPDLAGEVLEAAEPVVAGSATPSRPRASSTSWPPAPPAPAAGEGALMLRESARVLTAGHETYNYLHGPMEPLDAQTACLVIGDGREVRLAAGRQRAGLSHPAGHQPDRRLLGGRPHGPAAAAGPVPARPGRAADPADPAARLVDRQPAGPGRGRLPLPPRRHEAGLTGEPLRLRHRQRPARRPGQPGHRDAQPGRGHRHRPHRRAHRRRRRERVPRPGGAGSPHRLFGAVGDDDAGRWVASELERLGLAGDLLVVAGQSTGISIALEAPDRERAFLTAHGVLTDYGIDDIPAAARCPPTSSCSPATSRSPGCAATARGSSWSGLAPPVPDVLRHRLGPGGVGGRRRREVLDLLPLVDVFLPNEPEALALTGERTAQAALAALSRHCPGWVVLKRGPLGVLAAGPVARPSSSRPGRAGLGHDGRR